MVKEITADKVRGFSVYSEDYDGIVGWYETVKTGDIRKDLLTISKYNPDFARELAVKLMDNDQRRYIAVYSARQAILEARSGAAFLGLEVIENAFYTAESCFYSEKKLTPRERVIEREKCEDAAVAAKKVALDLYRLLRSADQEYYRIHRKAYPVAESVTRASEVIARLGTSMEGSEGFPMYGETMGAIMHAVYAAERSDEIQTRILTEAARIFAQE